MKENIIKKEVKDDPVALVLDTPDDKIDQFTFIPTGAVNAFAMSATIQLFGRKGAFNGNTPMEYYMQKLFRYNRSKGGYTLRGLLDLAQVKVETSADQSAERKLIDMTG